AIVVDGADFTRDIPLSDEELIAHLRLIDRAYQRASRWLLQEPYLQYYAASAWEDLRGYYHLQREENLTDKLANWSANSAAEKERLKGLLVGQCRNAERTLASCRSEFGAAVATRAVNSFHTRYEPVAAARWADYFKIP